MNQPIEFFVDIKVLNVKSIISFDIYSVEYVEKPVVVDHLIMFQHYIDN